MCAYTLLIVDDERDVREGIKAACEETGLGLECIGLCENGLEAYRFLQTQPVDIVISDIRMPLFDGLELAERIAQQFPFTKILFLSGYNEFEYVRKGLQFGVVDYLLKPVDDGELENALSKTIKQLDEKKQSEIREETMSRRAKLSARLLRGYFLKELLARPLPADEIEEGCSNGELILESKWYAVCALRLDPLDGKGLQRTEKERQLIIFALDNLLSELWDNAGFGYHYNEAGKDRAYLLVSGLEGESEGAAFGEGLRERLQRLHKELYRFRGLFKTTITICAGGRVADLRSLPLSRRNADDHLEHSHVPGLPDRPVYVSSSESLMEPALGEKESVATADYAKSLEADAGRKLVEAGKAFIRNHFDQSITLADVAGHVHVSPGYFSFLFKEVTGANYIQFLTECRIEAAKRLLENPEFKIYEVGERVGYEISRYFSDIFKKATGKTPLEYRNHILHKD